MSNDLSNEQLQFWLRLWYIVACAILLLAGIITTGVCYHRKIMVENGYEQVQLPSVLHTRWQKIGGGDDNAERKE